MSTAVKAVVGVVLVLALVAVTQGYQDDGTRVARPWPPVKKVNKSTGAGGSVAVLDPCSFTFTDKSSKPSAIHKAIQLYKPIIFRGSKPCDTRSADGEREDANVLKGIEITAQNPAPGVARKQEEYQLEVPAGGKAILTATSYEGVLRGLETFSQLVLNASLVPGGPAKWHIAELPMQMEDNPSFGHRGLLIDVARTFLPVHIIKSVLDGMMYSKMNVLHVHLTDSQAFPLQLNSNPEITYYGAQAADMVYTHDDIRDIISYAKERGIRVYPEIDSPGHTRAMGLAPTLHDIISCANVSKWGTCCNEPPCGQLNIASKHMMDVLRNVTEEITALFDDEYFHLGYDEVNFNCWKQDPSVQRYLKEHGMTIQQLLVRFYNQQTYMVHDVAPKKTRVYWEEAALQDPPLPLDKSTVLQVWRKESAIEQLLNMTQSDLIVSSSPDYYLDCGLGNMFGAASWCDPFKTWWHMYNTDMMANISQADADRILGGEACNWGELSGPDNTLVRIFPRATAFAARLWSYDNPVSRAEANLRIADHAERLSRRGIPVEGTTLQYCRLFPHMCYDHM